MSKFQVRVTAAGTEIVPLVWTFRLVADLGLGDAMQLSDYLRDHAPCLLVAGVDREVADHVAGLLREAGAEVAVEESTAEAPMLLCPKANQRYWWSWLVGPTPMEGTA
jgi:hypothetical protein